jgi:Peptidoglycan-binding protein, CsiV
MRGTLIASLALLLALSPRPSGAAAATTGLYQVEVIIFQATSPPAGEDLSASAEGRGFNGQLEHGAAPPALLRMLDASEMQLGGLASRLGTSGSWRVLVHAGWIQGATDWPQHAGLKLEDLGIAVPGLAGSVYVERGQYLHLGFDLHLGTSPVWSLRELRKVKFNEKNHFDHPGFGVIAIVSPARAPKAP